MIESHVPRLPHITQNHATKPARPLQDGCRCPTRAGTPPLIASRSLTRSHSAKGSEWELNAVGGGLQIIGATQRPDGTWRKVH